MCPSLDMHLPRPKSIPPEIHLMILNRFLEDRDIYDNSSSIRRTSVSKWIGFSLVCRAWRNCIHALVFRHIYSEHAVLSKLRYLDDLSTSGSSLPAAVDFGYPTTLSYIHRLTLHVYTIDDLPKSISILSFLPYLHDLIIRVHTHQNDSLSTHPTYIIPHVKRLSLDQCANQNTLDPKLLPVVCWILSCFPSTEHLVLRLARPPNYNYPDYPNPNTHHLLPPKLISFACTYWIGELFGRQLNIPTLRFFEISHSAAKTMLPFADYHCNTLESLRITSHKYEESEFWETILPRFNSLRFLSLGYGNIAEVPLEVIKSQHLCHFEFSFYGGYNSDETLSRICNFFSESCPMLRAISYHHPTLLEPIRRLAEGDELLKVIEIFDPTISPFDASRVFLWSSHFTYLPTNRELTHTQFHILAGKIPYLRISRSALYGCESTSQRRIERLAHAIILITRNVFYLFLA